MIQTYETKVDDCGRISLPEEARARQNMSIGAAVVIVEHEDELRISTPKRLVWEAQQYYLNRIPADIILVDELIGERREEARRE